MLEKTMEHLRLALYATAEAAEAVETYTDALYVPDGFDAIGDSRMERALYSLRAVHHIVGKDGNSTIQQPGLLHTNNKNIIPIVEQANDTRRQFGESLAQLNREEGFILKAGKAIQQALKVRYETFPLITKCKSINSKHLTRRFLILENVKHIGFYSEKMIRTEKVVASSLNNKIDRMSIDSRDLYRKILSGIKLSDLRYRYESSTMRHRANIQYNNGHRKNLSVSCPVITMGDNPPEIRRFHPVYNERATRNDKSNFKLIIKELRLYVKQ
ncbi:MAG: hypothetical protein RPS47_04785 [Colwellia sp.]|jgi:hypothetical protein